MTEARKDRRAPASIKVKYKSASMTEFVELLGGDVSRGGIFIKTKKPLEPGSLLKFEFQLQNGEPMISGVGRVAWRRTEEGARPTMPAGMGIKFIKLNGQSRLVIDRIEAKHGPGSRFEQTDGAEIATAMSSLPPGMNNSISSASGSTFGAVAVSQPPDSAGTLITPLRPEATRAAAEADAAASPRLRPDSANLNSPGRYSLTDSGRPTRSSPPLREAKTVGPKPSAAAAMAATFRPPPPAAGSVPPSHSSASSQPPAAAATARSASPVNASARATTRTTFNRSSSGAFASPSVPPPASGSGAPSMQGGAGGAGGVGGVGGVGGQAGQGASGSAAPRGVLGSGVAARRSAGAIPSTRTAARDASEFLASTFAVGGAGREVRSEAHAQAERARHDPHSVDLANELFGDLNEPVAKPDADAALDADPMLSDRPGAHTVRAANDAETQRPVPQDSSQPAAAARGRAASPAEAVDGRPSRPSLADRLRTSPVPPANDQLKLALSATTERPAAGGGRRALWLGVIAIVGAGIGAAVFYVQRGAPTAVPAAPELAAPQVAATPAPAAAAAPPPTAAAVEPAPAAAVPVDWSLKSVPAGAELSVDGAPAGKTPTTLKLTSGKTVQLSLRSPGYATKEESVSVLPEMPERTIELQHLPYELVVKDPVGATVKALDKSSESPAPLDLGVPFPGPTSLGEISVTIEKPGFQRASRKLTSSDFRERNGVFRAELSFSLTPLSAAAVRALAPKPPAAKVAPAAKAPSAAPPEPQAPPEPEAAAADKAAAPAPAKEPEKPVEAPPQAQAAPAPAAPAAAPAADPSVPAEP